MYRLSDVQHFLDIKDYQTAIKICDNYGCILGPNGEPIKIHAKH